MSVSIDRGMDADWVMRALQHELEVSTKACLDRYVEEAKEKLEREIRKNAAQMAMSLMSQYEVTTNRTNILIRVKVAP